MKRSALSILHLWLLLVAGSAVQAQSVPAPAAHALRLDRSVPPPNGSIAVLERGRLVARIVCDDDSTEPDRVAERLGNFMADPRLFALLLQRQGRVQTIDAIAMERLTLNCRMLHEPPAPHQAR